MTKHLDLGCGTVPRNPYGRDELYGVDLCGSVDGGPIRRANLALTEIPPPFSHDERIGQGPVSRA